MLEVRHGSCYPEAVVGVNVGLACVDGVIAFIAFYQLIRIHSRNPLLGWNRQKVFHLLIGSSNLGNFLYFVLTLVAACKSWTCWSQSCGFIVMAFPKILFVAAFLLLLSFWVDLCHHSNDDDEDDGWNPQDTLLEKTNTTDSNTSNRCRCFSFMSIRIGSRQKVVILVSILIFAIMVVASVLIWIGMGKNPIDSAVVAQVYVDLMAIAVLLLGGALACYGLILFLKMRKVRSDRASTEMWKVAGLAIVSVICFTSSAAVAMATNIPLVYHWHEQQIGDIYTSLLLVLYYFIGSSVPSAFVLFVMRELPPLALINSRRESTTIAFISDRSVAVHPQRRTNETNARSQISRASPV
ncbi:tobamovirus multiplication protein 1-like isoform X1 [Salvia splendens]|uniref:tobamovirus multiplication protein 1-like isoform X1 n=1 Tax=Salvia splendens TaxID=180675 RepID=UPI001C252CB6|nr:tobamovirus multiplication protein 1-like isoform X1 [Salvia splendens]